MTVEWISQEGIRPRAAILPLALGDRCGSDQVQLGLWQVEAWPLDARIQPGPEFAEHQVRPVIGGVAGDNPVVVVRITLRFHEGMMAALRAGVEVRMLRSDTVESLDDRLAGYRGDVLRAMAEVDDLLGKLRERPNASDVAVIVRHGRVAASERRRHSIEADSSGRSTRPLALELTVPAT